MIVLAGNNDGPLRLFQALQASGMADTVAGVALQREPGDDLRAAYASATGSGATVDTAYGFGGEDGLLDWLADLEAGLDRGIDVLVNAFCNFRFRRLLDASFDVLNVHLAPLPAYRGRHPVQWALINGEDTFGVTIHRMTASWDAGAILWKKTVPVPPHASVQALRGRLLDAVEADFAGFVRRYRADDVSPMPNDDTEATYVARRFPEDSRLQAWDDHQRIIRKVMAFRSEDYPAFFDAGDTRVVARHAAAGDRRYVGLAAPFVCGTGTADDPALTVACTDGRTVRLSNLSPQRPDVSVNQRLD